MGRSQSFWDRRRAAVQDEAQAEAARESEAEQAAFEGRPDTEILAELNLPDPDTLKMGDDFTGFMARQVPARLRNRALRKLWRSNPVLACVDGLNDYDDDYLAGSTGNGVIATGYHVGKGMLSHLNALTRQAADPADETPPSPPETVVAEAETTADTVTEAATPEASPEESTAAQTTPAPRRMRFRFDAARTEASA